MRRATRTRCISRPGSRPSPEDLAAGLVARHGLAGKHVIEIGCGDGYMLDLMAQHGVASATGFDPSMAGKRHFSVHRPR